MISGTTRGAIQHCRHDRSTFDRVRTRLAPRTRVLVEGLSAVSSSARRLPCEALHAAASTPSPRCRDRAPLTAHPDHVRSSTLSFTSLRPRRLRLAASTAAAAVAITLAPGAAVAQESVEPTVSIPAGVVEVPTTELAPGRRKVVSEGRAGVRRVVAVRSLHNGEVDEQTYRAKLLYAARGRSPWPHCGRLL